MSSMSVSFAFLSAIFVLCFSVVVLALIGRWVHGDAKEKGLPAVQWTLIALLVPGFLGLIIYLVYRSDKKAVMVCPSCGSQVDYKASFCTYCGYQCPPEKKVVVYSSIPKKVFVIVAGCIAFMFLGAIIIGMASTSYRNYRLSEWSISYDAEYNYPVLTAAPTEMPFAYQEPYTDYTITVNEADNTAASTEIFNREIAIPKPDYYWDKDTFVVDIPSEYIYSETLTDGNGLYFYKSNDSCSLSFPDVREVSYKLEMYIPESGAILHYEASITSGELNAYFTAPYFVTDIYELANNSSVNGQIDISDYAGQLITVVINGNYANPVENCNTHIYLEYK